MRPVDHIDPQPKVFKGDVSTIDEPGLIEALPQDRDERRVGGGRAGAKQANDRQCPLLRPRRERPRRRAAERNDELAPPHYSITSSAMASSDAGTGRPSVLAVVRLMASSNLLDCMTGRSAGFSPLRMRPA